MEKKQLYKPENQTPHLGADGTVPHGQIASQTSRPGHAENDEIA
jgi:hypothetical protein